MKRRILIVDDEPGIRQSLGGVLEDEGYYVEAVATGEECLEKLPGAAFELVLKKPPNGLKAVAGFVSSNASRRPGWLTLPKASCEPSLRE